MLIVSTGIQRCNFNPLNKYGLKENCGKLHPRAWFVKDKLFEIIHLGSILELEFLHSSNYDLIVCLSVVLSSQ